MDYFDFSNCKTRGATRADIGGNINVIRHKVVECEGGRKFFLRLSRSNEPQYPQYKENAAVDMFANVLAYNLAMEISKDFPVAEQHFITTPNGAVGVISTLLSAKHIGSTGGVNDINIANREQLPALFVFEQLIMNTDDKDEHFVLSFQDPTNGMRSKVYAVDHGHSINAWKTLSTMESVEIYADIVQPSSLHNPYKVTSMSDVLAGMKSVSSISDMQIVDSVDKTLREMDEKCGSMNEVSEFLKDETRSNKIPKLIFKKRKGNIEAIVRNKCKKLNLK